MDIWTFGWLLAFGASSLAAPTGYNAAPAATGYNAAPAATGYGALAPIFDTAAVRGYHSVSYLPPANPIRRTSCRTAEKFARDKKFKGTTYRYLFVSCPTTFKRAERFCKKRMRDEDGDRLKGGHLLWVDSSKEMRWIKRRIRRYYGRANVNFWIGARRRRSRTCRNRPWKKYWKWTSGEDFDYRNFASSQPDCDSRDERCGLMRRNGRWEDADCDLRYNFVCKAEVDDDDDKKRRRHYFPFYPSNDSSAKTTKGASDDTTADSADGDSDRASFLRRQRQREAWLERDLGISSRSFKFW